MSDKTHIEWTDATWNVITGCSVVSAGCKHCYAMRLAGTRLAHHPSRMGLTFDTPVGPVWNGHVRFNENWLDQPLRWKRPRRIFVCAHGDLFHEGVTEEWLDAVFQVMATAQRHTFQILTKRADRMQAYLRSRSFHPLSEAVWTMTASESPDGEWTPATRGGGVLPNVWIGVSAEHQGAADARIAALLATPAAVRGVSLEPLLGPISLAQACSAQPDGQPRDLDWVIVGGESGVGARPMHPTWVRHLRDECAAAQIPFFFKQWGSWAAHTTDSEVERGEAIPVGGFRTVRYGADEVLMRRAAKHLTGRRLDGVLHDGMPSIGGGSAP